MVSEVGFVASFRVLQVFLRRFFLPRESITQRRTNLTEIPADDSSSQAATQPSPPTQILYVGSNIPSPSKLELKGNAASNWKRFRQMWDNYEIASRLILRNPGAEISLLTTFGTPWGRYRWTRMSFVISPAPKEFQRRLNNTLEGITGVCLSLMIS